jgi:aminoacrylate hydrolase
LITARDGCGLFASVTGEGEALLLIPGLGGSAVFWNAIAPALAQRFKIILMDHRGAGRSDRPQQSYSVELLARDAVDALDHFEVTRAHLVGHSTGGAIAQVLAIDYPDRVNRIVLSGSWAKPDAQFRLLFETRLAILERSGPETYTAMSQFLGGPPDWIRDHIPIVQSAIANAKADLTPIAVAAERIRMVMAFNRLADLHKVVAPSLVIAATDDVIVPFHLSEELVRAIAGAQLLRTSGGHFFPRVNPRLFNEMVANFIAV